MIGLGIYYGIMIVMFFYNLFLFFSVKDKSYLFYVLYIASFAILQGTVNGLSFEYLGFLFPLINETAALLMILCCIFIVLFVQSFLHTKEHTPLFHKILKGIFIYLCIIPIIFLNLNYSQGAKIASITVVAVLSLIIIIGWLVLKRGYKPARYFLFAWTFYLIGSILLALRQVGILPSIFITEYGAQIGSTFEVILLSFGLADRINILRKEKVLAQAEALEAQRILNQELEDKVQRRTIQLEEAHQKIIILEKENTEKQLAGGFAHEMRNALVGPKLVIQHILGEDGEEPYESIGLANSRKLKEIYLMIKDFVPEDTLQDTLKAMKTIFENEERMDINLKLIYRAVSKGLSITQLIMDYAKIGNELTGKDSLDLNVIIKNLTDEYKKEWAVHPIRINLDLTKENSNIQGLETHFESIFKNLILNAKDAVLDKNLTDKRDLFIEIKTLVVSNNFQIEITDNGSGISPKNLSRIYDAFFSTKPDTGTGLGLGIVKKIVSIYNGKIDVKSELGKGTSFMISIPLQIGSK
jgi:signal transduction histidine kinase